MNKGVKTVVEIELLIVLMLVVYLPIVMAFMNYIGFYYFNIGFYLNAIDVFICTQVIIALVIVFYVL